MLFALGSTTDITKLGDFSEINPYKRLPPIFPRPIINNF